MSAMTEAEAREKRCPLVKSKIGSAEPEYHTYCIASDCMAWRWATEARKSPAKADYPLEVQGYCGAFGAP